VIVSLPCWLTKKEKGKPQIHADESRQGGEVWLPPAAKAEDEGEVANYG